MRLTYASLFAGIEAFSVAASRIPGVDWEPVFFSEIDPFASAVLATRFPAVANLGDICSIKVEKGQITNGTTSIALPRDGLDILAGGSPCQDVSVAGRRAGMQEGSGTRSSLAHEYARLVGELRPKVLLWENVPGVLSSNRGLDFAAFLRSLVELGYCCAWRVLDAQFCRVDGFPRAIPQRRRRVWLVGCARADEQCAAAVLFERQGLLGDTPPRRTAGQGFAAPAGVGPAGDDCVVGRTLDGRDTSGTLCAADGKGKNGQDVGKFVAAGCVAFDRAAFNQGVNAQYDPAYISDGSSPTMIARGPGGVAVEGKLRPYMCLDMTHANEVVREVEGDQAPTLQSRMGAGAVQERLARIVDEEFSGTDCATNEGEKYDELVARAAGPTDYALMERLAGIVQDEFPEEGPEAELAAYALELCMASARPVVAIDMDKCKPSRADRDRGQGSGMGVSDEGVAYTLQAREGLSKANAVACGFFPQENLMAHKLIDEASGTIKPGTAPGFHNGVMLPTIVRRLTPTECERLQGFPDNWTLVPYRGKPAEDCPDSPRYKALGNSWACNCAEWVLRRIVAAFRLGMV